MVWVMGGRVKVVQSASFKNQGSTEVPSPEALQKDKNSVDGKSMLSSNQCFEKRWKIS